MKNSPISDAPIQQQDSQEGELVQPQRQIPNPRGSQASTSRTSPKPITDRFQTREAVPQIIHPKEVSPHQPALAPTSSTNSPWGLQDTKQTLLNQLRHLATPMDRKLNSNIETMINSAEKNLSLSLQTAINLLRTGFAQDYSIEQAIRLRHEINLIEQHLPSNASKPSTWDPLIASLDEFCQILLNNAALTEQVSPLVEQVLSHQNPLSLMPKLEQIYHQIGDQRRLILDHKEKISHLGGRFEIPASHQPEQQLLEHLKVLDTIIHGLEELELASESPRESNSAIGTSIHDESYLDEQAHPLARSTTIGPDRPHYPEYLAAIQQVEQSLGRTTFENEPLQPWQIKSQAILLRAAQQATEDAQKFPIAAISNTHLRPPKNEAHTLYPVVHHTLPSYQIQVGEAHLQGRRNHQEDRSVIRCYPNQQMVIVGLFDGHGGHQTSQFAAQHLPDLIHQHVMYLPLEAQHHPSEVSKAIKDVFAYKTENTSGKYTRQQPTDIALPTFHHMWLKEFPNHPNEIQSLKNIHGSTALLSIFWKDHVYLINLGDSRAVWFDTQGRAKRLTLDQKANDEIEKKKIEDRGGFVFDNRVDGIISPTRALGDNNISVGRRPQITVMPRSELSDGLLLLGCDGIFEQLHENFLAPHMQTALHNQSDLGQVARDLTNIGYHQKSEDNLSAMVIQCKATPTIQ